MNFSDVVMAPGGNVGVGLAVPTFKLDVASTIRCTTLTQTSARDFMKLSPVSYAWNDKGPEQVRGSHDIGFPADEMNEVLPDIVAKNAAGSRSASTTAR